MSQIAVALTRCADYGPAAVRETLAKQFELLGGVGKFVRRGDAVLIKPNLIAPSPRRHATQTDPAIIVEAAKLLKDFGARPFVGDSPAWGSVFDCVRALGLDGPLKELSVPVVQLDSPRKCKIAAGGTSVGISSFALDADVIINLPKLKTHQQLVTTFAVKNMFGCVSGKRKAFLHFVRGKKEKDFCRLLIDVYRYLAPALTIIDAVTVMDGPGPIRGRARPLGWVIGGTEPVACEIICARLVNIDPYSLPIIKAAVEVGFGCCDARRIQVLGDSLPESPCADFELPELIPIRFSLLHVCKSICKQIALLLKSGGGKFRHSASKGTDCD